MSATKPKAEWTHDRGELVRYIQKLIDVWNLYIDKSWKVAGSDHPAHLPSIYACASQTVLYSQAVLKLYEVGLPLAALPMIRASLECAVTAAWLSVAKDETPALLIDGAKQRKKLLDGIRDNSDVDVEPAMKETLRLIEQLDGSENQAGAELKTRSDQIVGGAALYVAYRAASSYCHPGNGITEMYVSQRETTPGQPNRFALRAEPDFEGDLSWLATQAHMLLIAQIAADSILLKPMHKTQLANAAKKLGVSDTIERVVKRPKRSGPTS
ncbi:MAG: hypothetical protein QOH69_2959 [Actinomycetota bacterium]|jgi:hypothetical protein|nr:hypothetical protein [Actinomycetota bacterium]